MDEPPEDPGTRPRSLVPALLLVLAATFVVALLLTAWSTRAGGPMPAWLLKLYLYLLCAVAVVFLGTILFPGAGVPFPREPEAWLCQHCLKPYVPGAHFCPRCGAPKTFYAGTSPYERAHAQAWLLGKVARHPSRPIHLAGLGAIALGCLLEVFLALVQPFLEDLYHSFDSWVAVAAFALVLLYNGLFLAVVVLGLRSWCRRLRDGEPVEPESAYGAPPYFTHDVEWALPEFEVPPEESPPPLPAQDLG